MGYALRWLRCAPCRRLLYRFYVLQLAHLKLEERVHALDAAASHRAVGDAVQASLAAAEAEPSGPAVTTVPSSLASLLHRAAASQPAAVPVQRVIAAAGDPGSVQPLSEAATGIQMHKRVAAPHVPGHVQHQQYTKEKKGA